MINKVIDKIINQINGLLFGVTKEAEQSSYKNIMIELVEQRNNINKILINKTYFIFNYSAWSLARNKGYSFKEMLQNVDKKTFYFLAELSKIDEIMSVEITSLWRPTSGIHNLGLGIDIGKIITKHGTVNYLRHSNDQKDSILNKQIRKKIWSTGLLSQWIAPWKIRGILGERGGWRKNTKNKAIDRQHRNHLHLTIKS